MKCQLVFQEQTEIDRLAVQNRLLYQYEQPVLHQLLAGKTGLNVLDVGCNDGRKTVRHFATDAVARVVGLEYNHDLVRRAQNQFGSAKFSFHSCDVEAPDFVSELKTIQQSAGIDGFDLVYLSFVLMHLSKPEQFLQNLRPFLRDNACVLIIESNDKASLLQPDPDGLLNDFLRILDQDRYSGNRSTGSRLENMLAQANYGPITRWHDCIAAGPGEEMKKQAIFQTFFSYLPEDVSILTGLEPENRLYQSWQNWLDSHYTGLKNLIMQDQTHISMGMSILSCLKGQS